MRIARLNMDSQDKTRFEIQGKSSVKYHLKANHVVEAKRWFWALNNAIQWAKDEAKEDEKRRTRNAEVLRQAKIDQIEGRTPENPLDPPALTSTKTNGRGLTPPSLSMSNTSATKLSTYPSRATAESAPAEDDGSIYGSYDPSLAQAEVNRVVSQATTAPDMEAEDDDYGDYASSRDAQPTDKDALDITAQSAKLQLDLLADVASSLQSEKLRNPNVPISHPAVDHALAAYEGAVSSLKGLVQNLLQISRDRDAYWQYRLNREAYLRKMWEESMARVAQEHEELQSRIGESEEKRRRTKRALKEALENASTNPSRPISYVTNEGNTAPQGGEIKIDITGVEPVSEQTPKDGLGGTLTHKRSALSKLSSLCDSESDDEDEFFDAIDAGDIQVEKLPESEINDEEVPEDESAELRAVKYSEISPSFKGYEDPVRLKLNMDYDNRPRISLWVSFLFLCFFRLIPGPRACSLTATRVF